MNYFLLFSLFFIVFISYYIIFSKNTLYSINSLFIIIIFISIFYLSMGSFFLSMVNIFVYCGGIVAILIFAIHTNYLKKTNGVKFKETLPFFFLTFLFSFFIFNALKKYPFPKKFVSFKMEFIFEILLKDYIILFMLIPLLLLIGLIGAFVIIEKK